MRYSYILLSAIVLLVGLAKIEEQDRSLRLRNLPYMLADTRKQLSAIADLLRTYENAHGHYPANDQGLLVEPLVSSSDYGLSANDMLPHCRAGNSGILTRFGDPFIYENRRGIGSAKFADSGATLDHARQYSIRVDDGVYVWSVGARQACDALAYWQPRLSAAKAMVILVSAAFVALFVWASVASARRQPGRSKRQDSLLVSLLAGAALWFFTVLFAAPAFVKTCYEGSINWARKPELTAEYKSLLSKYNKRGVIRDSTYRKIIQAMAERDDRPL